MLVMAEDQGTEYSIGDSPVCNAAGSFVKSVPRDLGDEPVADCLLPRLGMCYHVAEVALEGMRSQVSAVSTYADLLFMLFSVWPKVRRLSEGYV